MSEKILMKGNEVIAEASIRAGCRYYFGYPITPQNEIPAYMAKKMPLVDGVFIQAESELAAINMVYGAASTGVRAMTTSSSPGISLKQEGISYLAGAELPAVVANVVRCGPGLGGILSSQSDYFQTVKGGGHGDYRLYVLAPANLQEMYELTVDAFDIAQKYRIVSMIMADSILGQMMEEIEFRDSEEVKNYDKSWTVSGTKKKREPNIITSIHIEPDILEELNNRLQSKYKEIEKNETRVEVFNCENADIIVAAFGIVSRLVKNVIDTLCEEGIKVGLIRPITLWPFPVEAFKKYAGVPKAFLTVEINAGQMVEDVRLSVNGKREVFFYGRTGGNIPSEKEITQKIREIYRSN